MPDVKITRLTDSADIHPSVPARDRELDAIRQRAYEIFLQRGESPGNEIDDWCAAEREILGLASGDISEHDGAYDVDVALPGFHASDVEIAATDTEVVVHALMAGTDSVADAEVASNESSENEVYRRFRLPTPVTFERISAELNDGVLHVHAPKSKPVTVGRPVLAPA
jgi:HSP20 family protein